MEETKTPLQIGTIKTNEDGTRQVVVSLGSRKAEQALTTLERQIDAANSKIDQLRKIGLADSVDEVALACGKSVYGLMDVLAKKLLTKRATFNYQIALAQAKEIVRNTFEVAKDSDEIRTPDGYNWWPVLNNSYLFKYKSLITLTKHGLKLSPDAEEVIAASFVKWATGKEAERFIRLCELIRELNQLTAQVDLNFWGEWQYYFYLDKDKGLQMTDTWGKVMFSD